MIMEDSNINTSMRDSQYFYEPSMPEWFYCLVLQGGVRSNMACFVGAILLRCSKNRGEFPVINFGGYYDS
jgi:hypothetical protein